MPPAQLHGLAPHQDTVSPLTIDRQRKLKIKATLATTTKKASKELPCHRLMTRTIARLVGNPKVRSHPNKKRQIGRGAPKKSQAHSNASHHQAHRPARNGKQESP